MSIYKKLFEAKKEIGKISKDSTNPFFKSKYFDINALLEHVEPILQKNKLILLQPIKDGKVFSIIVDIDNMDDFIESELLLPNLNDPQKLGSAITYYRRYTLQSLLGLQAEDDDGNKASTPEDNRAWLNENTDEWSKIMVAIESKQLTNINQITKFRLNKKIKKTLEDLL